MGQEGALQITQTLCWPVWEWGEAREDPLQPGSGRGMCEGPGEESSQVDFVSSRSVTGDACAQGFLFHHPCWGPLGPILPSPCQPWNL